ncbi:VanW family protein [Alkalihalobacillus deserti]|uniref:VanW family protein n=1 Tax=Alkalihalobacillus deserti TaxID=2879466 RepID=UPI001D148170|nr:VanW family protein [Alkalihalobacillus deserti]
MKKSLFFIPLLILVGCNNFVLVEDPKAVAIHSSYFINETKEKPIVYWRIQLKDEWNDTVHTITMNDYGYLFADQRDEKSLRQLAIDLAIQIDTPMQNPRLNENGELLPGKERVVLLEQELVDQLLEIEVGTTDLVLPINVTEPSVTEDDLLGIENKKIAEYKTYFNPSVTGRAQNVLLSAKAISGVIIGPGDSFSFNQTVGERTRERGYQEAKEIVDKEFIMGIGGGICQTSSTLFNAVDQAGLEMIERFTHSREIGYVPEGRDATVSWGGPDFRFKNSNSFPVLIRSHVDLNRGEIQISVHTQ